MSIQLPHIHVACAIIQQDGLILAAQRSATMSLPLKWEFPGGKLEAGESPQVCLLRELNEELGISVTIGQGLPPHTHCYPSFTVTLYPFLCHQLQGYITLHEHNDARWLKLTDLLQLDWAEADLPLIQSLVQIE
jgi:8-oxo-dGTP diphosphatase